MTVLRRITFEQRHDTILFERTAQDIDRCQTASMSSAGQAAGEAIEEAEPASQRWANGVARDKEGHRLTRFAVVRCRVAWKK
jgi:hypothetical protein